MDFIKKIESLECPSNSLLISYYVTSMYTNMTFDELLSAVRKAITECDLGSYVNIPIPDTDDIIFLLKCVLENNIFEFNGKYYKQTIGAAMGAVPSQ